MQENCNGKNWPTNLQFVDHNNPHRKVLRILQPVDIPVEEPAIKQQGKGAGFHAIFPAEFIPKNYMVVLAQSKHAYKVRLAEDGHVVEVRLCFRCPVCTHNCEKIALAEQHMPQRDVDRSIPFHAVGN